MKRRWIAGGLALAALIPLASCVSTESLGASPLDFECRQAYLDDYLQGPAMPRIYRQIQRDAAGDLPSVPPSAGAAKFVPESASVAEKAYFDALTLDPLYVALSEAADDKENVKPLQVLMLSGGGQWGAFGAGFLKSMHERGKLPHFDIVTGVSTGAIQSLLVAPGKYERLYQQYTDDGDLAKEGGILTALFKGYLNNTAPLRRRLEDEMCVADGNCPLLNEIAASTTQVFMGMVDSDTGDFKVLDVSRMLRGAKQSGDLADAARSRPVRDCLAGVVMASSAVPLQLRAVRLHDSDTGLYHTYTDGGVRLSVFDAHVIEVAKLFTEKKGRRVEITAIRNGPTIVQPSLPKPGESMALIDRRPNAYAVAMQSYATLVNQNEVMSIAALRLSYPDSLIRVATADGYRNPSLSWRPPGPVCIRPDDRPFDHGFMQCLADFGIAKAAKAPSPWIELDEAGAAAPSRP